MFGSVPKTTVFTLQNVLEHNLGKSIRKASPHIAPSTENVKQCLQTFAKEGCTIEYVDLKQGLSEEARSIAEDAGIGIIRKAPDTLWGPGTIRAMESEFDQHMQFVNKKQWSKQHYRDKNHPKGFHDGVVNLHMRWHLYIGERAIKADYPNDQSEVVSFDSMPLAKRWKIKIMQILQQNGVNCPNLNSCTNINFVEVKLKELFHCIFRLWCDYIFYVWHVKMSIALTVVEKDLKYTEYIKLFDNCTVSQFNTLRSRVFTIYYTLNAMQIIFAGVAGFTHVPSVSNETLVIELSIIGFVCGLISSILGTLVTVFKIQQSIDN